MTRLTLALACLVLAVPSWAQHPCDTTPPSILATAVGTPVTIGWCHNGRDTSTPPQPITITDFQIFRNAALIATLPVAWGPPNAAGDRFQSVARTETTAGTVQYEVAARSMCGNPLVACSSTRVASVSLTVGQPPPSSIEVCGDGIDNDADGLIDEGCAPPPPPPTGPNLALARPVTASSFAPGDVATGGLGPARAVDGNAVTRWESVYADPQWLQVDLGAALSVSRVVFNWAFAYGRDYQVQTSLDALTWTSQFTTATGNGGIDTVSFAAVPARYVRMLGTVRGTPYGYSLREFEVYGAGVVPPPPPPLLTLSCPPAMTAPSPTGQSIPVTFQPATPSGGVPPIAQTALPASGSLFGVGTATVTVAATDAAQQKASCSFPVTVTDTSPPPPPPPPPPVQTGSVTVRVTTCQFTLTSSGPPTTATGWGVQFRRGTTLFTNVGSRDITAPFTTLTTLAPGTYAFSGVWTRTGSATVIQSLGTMTCPSVVP